MITTLPRYYLARKLGRKPPLPMNYTLSITDRCNSRCKTCGVWRREEGNELGLEEWGHIFDSIGRSPYWVTLSGGEPFLREDLIELHDILCEACRPKIVNIPTNGLLPRRTEEWAWEMAMRHQEVSLVVNVSIDHLDAGRNDEIRGMGGALDRALDSFHRLKALRLPNLTVGIHSVISAYNVADFPSFCQGIAALGPDQYITEIAEEREELGTMGWGITPTALDYTVAISHMPRLVGLNGIPKLTKAFRREYYSRVVKWLSNGSKPMPCYAGYASAHISPLGDVWFCCIKAESMGNLRAVDYDFGRIWRSPYAQRMRRLIKTGRCSCPMANVSYTNMLLHPPTVARVLKSVVTG